MRATYKRSNEENNNRNDFVKLTSRRVGSIYRVYAAHTVSGETEIRKGVKEFGSMKEVYAFFDRMEDEMPKMGWTRK